MEYGAIIARSQADRRHSGAADEAQSRRRGGPLSVGKLRDWFRSKVTGSTDEGLPLRLREKIEALERGLGHANGSLKKYGQAAIDRARGKQGAGVSFAKLDAANLDSLVRVENQRHPDLNLRHFVHQKDFIEALKTEGPASFRAIFPQTDERTGKPADHHVMADVRLRPGRAPTVVVTEPAVFFHQNLGQLQRHNQLLNELEQQGVALTQVALIEVGAQKSTDDCVMYALHHAIKAHKNRRYFDELHRNLQQGVGPAGDAEPESRQKTSLAKLPFNGLRPGTHAAFGGDVLPPDFYKHGASLEQAEQLANRPDGRMGGRVNSAAHAQGESLPERNLAFRIRRTKFPGDAGPSQEREFSASIDGFRLQEIERAVAAMAGKPVARSKSSP